MRNYPQSHPATIAERILGRTLISLPDATWNALGIGIGDRVMVEAGDDTCAAEVTGRRVVTLALSIGEPGDFVRVRRPRGERFAYGHAVTS